MTIADRTGLEDPEPPSAQSAQSIMIDNACAAEAVPSLDEITLWVERTVHAADREPGETSIRIVSIEEITELNRSYRHKDTPTNVLSFPFDAPPGVPADELPAVLGDIAVCAEVVAREAAEQHKTVTAHWAHMIIHGTLHLLGFDHIDDAEAERMEALEIRILAELGFADPYQPLELLSEQQSEQQTKTTHSSKITNAHSP